MADPITMLVIFLLVVLIGIQALERYFFAEQMHKQQEKLMIAFLAKSPTDYAVAVKVSKEPVTEIPPDTDEIALGEASDETFDKFIKSQTQ